MNEERGGYDNVSKEKKRGLTDGTHTDPAGILIPFLYIYFFLVVVVDFSSSSYIETFGLEGTN